MSTRRCRGGSAYQKRKSSSRDEVPEGTGPQGSTALGENGKVKKERLRKHKTAPVTGTARERDGKRNVEHHL